MIVAVEAVVRIRAFRRLWLVLGLSALGDWLGLLATAVFASAQVSAPAAKGLAFGSVVVMQLLPALVLGPVAGFVADRFDRRLTMVLMDVFRFVLFASIPVVGLVVDRPVVVVTWAAAAMFLVQTAAMVWMPAKEAAVPNLLPRSALEAANQLTLATTYGITPVLAALAFAGMARLPLSGAPVDATDAALFFNALTFLASAVVVLRTREISGRGAPAGGRPKHAVRGFAFVGRFVLRNPVVRGLVVGVLGAFVGAGVVVGTAKFYAESLGGGDATFGILFAALFGGFGAGIVGGPRLIGAFSRRRWFGLSIALAGLGVAGLSVAPRPAGGAIGAAVVGAGAGMAFLAGITLIGAEVADEMRGRVFAFLQTAARLVLMVTISVVSVLVGLGSAQNLSLASVVVELSTTRMLLLLAGSTGVVVGLVALRQMDDRPGVPVMRDLWRALRRGYPET